MYKDGFEILKIFHKKLLDISNDDKKKIEKLVKDKGGTFKGAAWSFYQNKRYSPHSTTKSDIKTKIVRSKRVSKRQPDVKPKERKPYVKELRPGIRTIMFK
jgi:hypothetical protein